MRLSKGTSDPQQTEFVIILDFWKPPRSLGLFEKHFAELFSGAAVKSTGTSKVRKKEEILRDEFNKNVGFILPHPGGVHRLLCLCGIRGCLCRRGGWNRWPHICIPSACAHAPSPVELMEHKVKNKVVQDFKMVKSRALNQAQQSCKHRPLCDYIGLRPGITPAVFLIPTLIINGCCCL